MLRTSPKLVTNTLKQQRSVLVGVKSRISNLYTTLASKTISSTMPAATEETNKVGTVYFARYKTLHRLHQHSRRRRMLCVRCADHIRSLGKDISMISGVLEL